MPSGGLLEPKVKGRLGGRRRGERTHVRARKEGLSSWPCRSGGAVTSGPDVKLRGVPGHTPAELMWVAQEKGPPPVSSGSPLLRRAADGALGPKRQQPASGRPGVGKVRCSFQGPSFGESRPGEWGWEGILLEGHGAGTGQAKQGQEAGKRGVKGHAWSGQSDEWGSRRGSGTEGLWRVPVDVSAAVRGHSLPGPEAEWRWSCGLGGEQGAMGAVLWLARCPPLPQEHLTWAELGHAQTQGSP